MEEPKVGPQKEMRIVKKGIIYYLFAFIKFIIVTAFNLLKYIITHVHSYLKDARIAIKRYRKSGQYEIRIETDDEVL